jgi:hypothetical protein
MLWQVYPCQMRAIIFSPISDWRIGRPAMGTICQSSRMGDAGQNRATLRGSPEGCGPAPCFALLLVHLLCGSHREKTRFASWRNNRNTDLAGHTARSFPFSPIRSKNAKRLAALALGLVCSSGEAGHHGEPSSASRMAPPGCTRRCGVPRHLDGVQAHAAGHQSAAETAEAQIADIQSGQRQRAGSVRAERQHQRRSLRPTLKTKPRGHREWP